MCSNWYNFFPYQCVFDATDDNEDDAKWEVVYIDDNTIALKSLNLYNNYLSFQPGTLF